MTSDTDDDNFQEWREFQQWKVSRKTQTIERTGKKWKVAILASTLVMIAGLIGACISLRTGAGDLAIRFVYTMAIGLAFTIFAKVGAWWYHG